MSNRIKKDVQTTKDRVAVFTVNVVHRGAWSGINTVTGASGAIAFSTDQSMVTGSSTTHQDTYITRLASGSWRVRFPADNCYKQFLGIKAQVIQPDATADRHEVLITKMSTGSLVEGFEYLTCASSASTGRDLLTTSAVTASFILVVRDTDRNA